MFRPALILSLTALLAVGAQALPARGAGAALTRLLMLPATADAYVTSSAKGRNFGGKHILRTGSRPATRSYIRFAPLDATFTKAFLRLTARSGSHGLTIRSADPQWAERGITFANAPRATGGPVVRVGRVRPGRSVRVDVTRLVKGSFTASFVLTGGSGTFASREAASSARPTLFYERGVPTLAAAGDIGDCNASSDEATGALISHFNPGTVAALGDLAYENGTLDEFNACYKPAWGAFQERTKPTPGNHEYHTASAAGYFAYWGAVAGNPAQGWYSYDIRGWHIVSLNSNCNFIGGCLAGSPEETWLRSDLAAHQARCTLAYWHHPLFSGYFGTEETDMKDIWQALWDNNADVVLNGHAHDYQRFAPQNAAGVADPARGIREFIVGTGGEHSLHPIDTVIPNTEVTNASTFGVLFLSLRATGYDWAFRPIAGQSFTDSGSQACH